MVDEIAKLSRLVGMFPAFTRLIAVEGAVLWLIILLIPTSDSTSTELIHKVVLFAVLVIVPLGLSVIGPEASGNSLFRLVAYSLPHALILTVLSFLFGKGPVSAILASTWLIVTILVAIYGLARLVSHGFKHLEELSIDAGLLYLPVAAVWLVIYRLGSQPFGYGETIILLTAVHFHFAGFATPIIAGMNGRVLAGSNYPRKIFAVSVFAIVAAMPLVAAGITFSPWLGFVGTLLLTLGLVLQAVLTFGWVRPLITPVVGRTLLMIGAISSCVAMIFACLYAYSLATQTLILTIPQMAMTHGLLNAFGFVTCSLIAWSQIAPRRIASLKEAEIVA